MEYEDEPTFLYDGENEQTYEEEPEYSDDEEEQETARQTGFAMSDEFEELNNLDASSKDNEYSGKAITLLAGNRPVNSGTMNSSHKTVHQSNVGTKKPYSTSKQTLA